MSIRVVSKREEKKLTESAEIIATIKEFSKSEDCLITANYYHVNDDNYLEVVQRQYFSKKKEDSVGRFLYDGPEHVIFALLHSCDPELHKKAEQMLIDNLEGNTDISIFLPQKIKNRIDSLSKKLGCSSNLMLFNLIVQGLDSETELKDFYEDYECRTISPLRKSIDDLDNGDFIINSKEQA